MLINFWDCKFGYGEEWNLGSEDIPEYEWVYECNHPESKTHLCELYNKYDGEKAECKLLGVTE